MLPAGVLVSAARIDGTSIELLADGSQDFVSLATFNELGLSDALVVRPG